MNNNQKFNEAAIKQFRKELYSMLDDLSEVDIKVLNKAVNVGLDEVKKLTPVGVYKNRTGGTMRKRWNIVPAKKLGNTVEASIYNNVEYAPYVNYGHRIVNKSGETVGWVTGKFMLERAVYRVEKTIQSEFKREIERINHKHGK